MEEKTTPDTGYDPAHLAAAIIIVISVITIIFWLFWTLLVYSGGIFTKIIPALQVLLKNKTLQDYGWIGYPYQMGIFSGFIANSIALIFVIALIFGMGWILKGLDNRKMKEEERSNESTNQ